MLIVYCAMSLLIHDFTQSFLSVEGMISMNNHIVSFGADVITHPCPEPIVVIKMLAWIKPILNAIMIGNW